MMAISTSVSSAAVSHRLLPGIPPYHYPPWRSKTRRLVRPERTSTICLQRRKGIVRVRPCEWIFRWFGTPTDTLPAANLSI